MGKDVVGHVQRLRSQHGGTFSNAVAKTQTRGGLPLVRTEDPFCVERPAFINCNNLKPEIVFGNMSVAMPSAMS